MRAGLYARVSTNDQHCEMQLREMREYCKRREWEVVGEYVDTGWSGAKVGRPALRRIMQAAHKRQIDCVMVWKSSVFQARQRQLLLPPVSLRMSSCRDRG